MKLTGKTAVVTGAARGIGREIALRLAQEGAAVIIIDVRDADGIVRELHGSGFEAMALAVDITDFYAVHARGTDYRRMERHYRHPGEQCRHHRPGKHSGTDLRAWLK